MVAEDVDAVLVMCHRFFLEWPAERRVIGELDEDVVATVLGRIADGAGAGWLAHVDGDATAVVGMLIVAVTRNAISGEVVADELVWWVDPAHRRGRVGIDLLRAAQDWSRTSGVRVLKLCAPAGSTVGRFLSRVGFTEVETVYLQRLG